MIKKISFYLIAFSLPLFLLVLIELGLRLFSYGDEYPLFVEHKGLDGFLQTNPDVIKRFYSDESSAPNVSPDTFIFPANKAKDTIRIVTMGGSSMAGYPYGRFGSPAGMLKQQIMALHPKINVEVISVSMSAINSYALLDFSEEVAGIAPDAVLIYAGHNEYLGVMGASSNLSTVASRESKLLFLTLKDYKVYQLVADIIAFFKSAPEKMGDDLEGNRTLMAQVAQNQSIPFQSEVYNLGLIQFRENMRMTIDSFASKGIPVFISTIASNEKDQRPFESVQNSEIDKTIDVINARPARAKFLLDKPIIAKADDANHADFMYTMGTALFQDKKAEDALEFFTKAKDYDLLRFRAPSQVNNEIRTLSETTSAHLVDSLELLKQKSMYSGIIGNQLMLEHLHPNTTGYFWIAAAFYKQLIDKQILPQSTVNTPIEQLLALQPVSATEQLHAQSSIDRLLSDYPFTDSPQPLPEFTPNTRIEEVALDRMNGQDWITNQQALFKVLQQEGMFLDAALVAGNLYQAVPNQANLANVAAIFFLRSQSWGLAEYYARQAVLHSPQNTNYLLTLAEAYYKSGQREEALIEIENVLKIEPDNTIANQIKQQL